MTLKLSIGSRATHRVRHSPRILHWPGEAGQEDKKKVDLGVYHLLRCDGGTKKKTKEGYTSTSRLHLTLQKKTLAPPNELHSRPTQVLQHKILLLSIMSINS
jgi:hypothetical protein